MATLRCASECDSGRQWAGAFCESPGKVCNLVPKGFSVYLRVLHPVKDKDGNACTWRDVAGWSGKIPHRLMQWEKISVRAGAVSDGMWRGSEPAIGPMPRRTLRTLTNALETVGAGGEGIYGYPTDVQSGQAVTNVLPDGRSKRQPGDRVIWGPGWKSEGTPCDVVGALGRRKYLLFKGPLTSDPSVENGSCPEGTVQLPPPSVLWSSNGDWWIGSSQDLDSTIVAADSRVAGILRRQAKLELYEVNWRDRLDVDADVLNA
jgi:hypothetical protein